MRFPPKEQLSLPSVRNSMAQDSNRGSDWNFDVIKSIETMERTAKDEVTTGMELGEGETPGIMHHSWCCPSDVPDVIEYLNSVKTEFAHDPEAYKCFLILIKNYWYNVDQNFVDSK